LDAVYDDTLSRPLTAERSTNLGRSILLRSISSAIGIAQREDVACS